MDERIRELLQRQAQWQTGRKSLAWPDKLRLSVKMRQAVVTLRAAATHRTPVP
jgi:hypothetical protein